MNNTEKVSAALSEWGFNVMSQVLPQYRIPPGSAVGNMMQGFLGIDPSSYNVWKELGFLAEPIIQMLVSPFVLKALGGLPEEQVKDMAMSFADAFLSQAKKKGSVDLFGIELGVKSFEGLKQILTEKFEEE